MYRIDFETPLILKGGKKCEGLLITEPFPNPENIFLMKGLFEGSDSIKIPIHKIGQIIEALQEIDLRGVKDNELPPWE